MIDIYECGYIKMLFMFMFMFTLFKNGQCMSTYRLPYRLTFICSLWQVDGI